ncbi:MAG: kinase-like domain-containing protein [Olpidium bornovanus]|uniref:Kinase-like domain-containing protein n=1 Tax=Olpidium bornovanus TaxID=278681 RepID=A0A8H8A0R2_9FUNG|nr:MAG: kinase-like domain-containing protein [Olpidium bornovanus]
MEIYVIKNLPHPGVIKFIDMFDDHKFFYLVMELHGTPWTSSNPVLQGSRVDATRKTSSAPPTTSPASKKGGLVGAANRGADPTPHPTPSPQDAYEPQPDLPFQTSRDAPIPPPPPRPAMVRRASCDLFECIEHHSKFSENKAKLIFRQVVDSGLGVPGPHIFLSRKRQVKLIDFGSAVVVNPTGRLFDRFYGTINYASPEILRGEKYQAEAAEIWSLGILLYTLLYGEVPFNDPQQAMYAPYVKPKHQSSRECLHLLNWTLEKSADRRAPIEDVFGPPWLAMTEGEMEQARL